MFVISEHRDLNASSPLDTVGGPLQELERRPILHLLRACVRMQVSNPLGNLFQITMQDSQDFRTITHVLLFCTARNVQARRIMGSCQSCIATSSFASNASATPAASPFTPTAAFEEWSSSTWIAPVTYLLAFYDIASILLLIQRFFINYVGCLFHRFSITNLNVPLTVAKSAASHPPGSSMRVSEARLDRGWRWWTAFGALPMHVTRYRMSRFGY